jgi:hypothetical protein
MRRLFAPVFFFHRRQLYLRWIQAGDFKINAAVGTNDDLANYDVGKADFGITFRAVGSGHGFPPRLTMIWLVEVEFERP